jgi:hypothetical protein
MSHWVSLRSLSCARNHLTDLGPRFGMLANVSSVVSRRSPIVFSPANFTALRIRVGKRTISTGVSFGRSGPRSNILQPIHLAFAFSTSSTVTTFNGSSSLVALRRIAVWVQLSSLANLIASDGLRGARTHVHLSRRVVGLIYRHQKPNAPAMAANKACHQNNRGRAALIERRMASASRFRD